MNNIEHIPGMTLKFPLPTVFLTITGSGQRRRRKLAITKYRSLKTLSRDLLFCYDPLLLPLCTIYCIVHNNRTIRTSHANRSKLFLFAPPIGKSIIFSVTEIYFECVGVGVGVFVGISGFIKLRLTAQSVSIMLVILCYSHWCSQGVLRDQSYLLRKLLIRRDKGDILSLHFLHTPSSSCAPLFAFLLFSR